MKNLLWVGLGAAFILAGCVSSPQFYAQEVDKTWTEASVKTQSEGASVAGVKVKKTKTQYSNVVSNKNLLAPAYTGGRQEVWSVEGPDGLSATIEVIQTGLVFEGSVKDNVLTSKSTDYAKAKQVFKVTTAAGTTVSDPVSVGTLSDKVTVGTLGLAPYYKAKSGAKVTDFKAWGLLTGVRLSQDGALAGYLDQLSGPALRTAPGQKVDPVLVALALVASQPRFSGAQTPPLKLVPEVVDLFGIPFQVNTNHN